MKPTLRAIIPAAGRRGHGILTGFGIILVCVTLGTPPQTHSDQLAAFQKRKAVLEAKLREAVLAAEGATPGEDTKARWAKLSGTPLISAFCRLLALKPTMPIAQPSFRDEVLRAAGDIKSMSREDLQQLNRDVTQASIRDEGLAMELQMLPANQREGAVAKLREKWAARRGENLKSEYYVAMAAYLRHRADEARTKDAASLGFADLTLLEGLDPATLGRDALHDFHESVGRAAAADQALSPTQTVRTSP